MKNLDKYISQSSEFQIKYLAGNEKINEPMPGQVVIKNP